MLPIKDDFFTINENITQMHLYIVDNKAKGRILKWVFQESKACQIFQKMNIFYPMIRTHKCAYQGLRNGAFLGKFGVLCFFFFFLKHPF